MERLVRRCGYDAVAAKMPEGDMRLLTHIRKEAARRNRLKKGRVGPRVMPVDVTLGYKCTCLLLLHN